MNQRAAFKNLQAFFTYLYLLYSSTYKAGTKRFFSFCWRGRFMRMNWFNINRRNIKGLRSNWPFFLWFLMRDIFLLKEFLFQFTFLNLFSLVPNLGPLRCSCFVGRTHNKLFISSAFPNITYNCLRKQSNLAELYFYLFYRLHYQLFSASLSSFFPTIS